MKKALVFSAFLAALCGLSRVYAQTTPTYTSTPTPSGTATATYTPNLNTPTITFTPCYGSANLGDVNQETLIDAAADPIYMNRYQVPGNMTLQTMSAYFSPLGSNIATYFDLVIYADDGTGSTPTSLLGQTNPQTAVGTGWANVPLVSPVTVTAGKYVWLGLVTYQAGNLFSAAVPGVVEADILGYSYTTVPSQATGSVTVYGGNGNLFSVYASGCPSSGTPFTTATATNTRTGTPTPTVTTTSCNTATPTPTSTPNLSTNTPTATNTPCSSSVTIGTADMASSPTPVSFPIDQYVATAYTVVPCGLSLTDCRFWAAASSTGTIEYDIYDGTNRIVQGFAPVSLAGGGWIDVPLGSVPVTCGDQIILALHSLSPGLTVGSGSANSCQSTNSIYSSGYLPVSFPQPALLTSSSTSPCYEMYVVACGGAPTATPTNTPTSTTDPGTATPTATPTSTGCAIVYVNSPTPPPTVTASGPGTVLGLPLVTADKGNGCYNKTVTQIGVSIIASGNLSSDIQEVQLWNSTNLVATAPYASSVTFSGASLGIIWNEFDIKYSVIGAPSGSIQTQLTSIVGYGGGYPIFPIWITQNGIGNVNFNSLTATFTNTPTPTITNTPTQTITSTYLLTATPTNTLTSTLTGTSTSDPTLTPTASSTATNTPSNSPTNPTTPGYYTLHVVIYDISGNPADINSITSAPAGVSCVNGNGTCSAAFMSGTAVTLTATGFNTVMTGFQGCLLGQSNVLTMTQNCAVTAYFEETTSTPTATFSSTPTGTPTDTPTNTPTSTTTSTPTFTPSGTTLLTATPTNTLTPGVDPTLTMTFTYTPTPTDTPASSPGTATDTCTFTPTSTPTGCALVHFTDAGTPYTTYYINTGAVTAVGLNVAVNQPDIYCSGLPDYLTSISFNFTTTGNLDTQIQQALLFQNSSLLSSVPFNSSGITFNSPPGGWPVSSTYNPVGPYTLEFVLSSTALGTIVSTHPAYFSFQGYQLNGGSIYSDSPVLNSPPITIVAITPTPTNTLTPGIDPTLTMTFTYTPTPTATGCDNVYFTLGPVGNPWVAGSTVSLNGSFGPLPGPCTGNSYTLNQLNLITSTTGNLDTQILQVDIWQQGGVLVGTAPFSNSVTFTGLSIPSGNNAFTIGYVTSPSASGSVATTIMSAFGTGSAGFYYMSGSPNNNFGVPATVTVGIPTSPTATFTPTNTDTPTATFTGTWYTSTPTNTPTPTGTFTVTNTPTGCTTCPATDTFTWTPTATNTHTPTSTGTLPITATYTPTISPTATTDPGTATSSPTFTPTPTGTWYTATPTNTWTATPTGSFTGTWTPTSTVTNTPTPGGPTATFTDTKTPTNTATGTWNTFTPTPSITFTFTPTFTATIPVTFTPVATPILVVSQVINPSLPAMVTMSGGVTVSMAANTLSQTVTMTISEYAPSSAPVSNTLQVSFMPNVYLIDSQWQEPLSGMSVTITLPYDPVAIPSGYTTADLSIGYFNGANWVFYTPTVDTVNHTVTVVVNHLSWWAVVLRQHTPTPAPTVDKPTLYPNPVTGSQVRLYAPGETGTYDLKVQVYTIGYRKVQDVTFPNVQAGAGVTLDLLDKAGVQLSNGLYYVVVNTPQGRSTLKLLVLR